MAGTEPSFFVRHDFLIRRLHSLTGIIFGGYVCVHLLVNASILDGARAFQNNVHAIHALGPILPLVEWTFIFLPILFHAFVGLAIIADMVPNNRNYPYEANWRYTLQRISGLYLFFFIIWHVFQMHGWFHFEWWLEIAHRWGGAQFSPYNAASTVGVALQNLLVAFLYALGVIAAAFHFFNGIWTAGITWGVWTRPQAQTRALYVCLAGAVALAGVGLGALWGAREIGATPESVAAAQKIEDEMYQNKVEAGLIPADEHKRSHHRSPGEGPALSADPVSSPAPTTESGE